MTVRAWTWRHAVQEAKLASTTKLVLLNLSLYMNERGEGCFPSTEQQADDCSLSERAVCEHLSKAEEAGFIVKIRHGFGDKKWARHEYKPRFPENEKALTDDQCESGEPTDKALTQGQCKALTQGQSNIPSKNSNEPCSPLAEQDFTEDFEKLWQAWTPFEMFHGDRPQAERKYAKIRADGVSADQVLLAARVYCQQCRNTRCKTKHIENWLGQHVWKPEDKGLGDGNNGKSRTKKPAVADAAKPRALKHQPWHVVVKQQLGETVYRAWIERLWLEGDIVYCSTRFIQSYVMDRYGGAIMAAVGQQVRYVADPPPEHAFADFNADQPAGEIHGHHEVTA